MTGPLLVLTDGEPNDSALVRTAREYADANDCSVTLLRVLPEVDRAFRTDSGVNILPWQIMQWKEAYAKQNLQVLRERFLRGRSYPNTIVVRFGGVVDEVASVVAAEQPHAVLARSTRKPLLRWRQRDRQLKRNLPVPVHLVDAAGNLMADSAPEPMIRSLNQLDKVEAIRRLPAFAGLSQKKLESMARHLDEARVEEGTTLVHEGRPNSAFWIVVEGELVRTLRGKVLDHITPPSVVGVPSMLDGKAAWASVATATPIRALVASTEQFRELSADEGIAVRLWEQAGARLRHHILSRMPA